MPQEGERGIVWDPAGAAVAGIIRPGYLCGIIGAARRGTPARSRIAI
jgi:hypothetical protein